MGSSSSERFAILFLAIDFFLSGFVQTKLIDSSKPQRSNNFSTFQPSLFLSPKFNSSPSSLHYHRALLDIHTSLSTQKRIRPMKERLLSHPLFQTKEFIYRFLFPDGENISDVDIGYSCSCGDEWTPSLNCRVEHGYQTFLSNFPNTNWYFRVIDDSYIVPDNLLSFLDKLETFVEPSKHIIVKGLQNPHHHRWPRIHGGAGWLLSRGAVQFFKEFDLNLLHNSDLAQGGLDDNTFSVILNFVFRDHNVWGDPRFVTCEPCSGESSDLIEQLLRSNFTDGLKNCEPEKLLVPLKEVIAFHTCFSSGPVNLSLLAKLAPSNVWVSRGDPGCVLYNCPNLTDQNPFEKLKSTTPLLTKSDFHQPILPVGFRADWVDWDDRDDLN